MEQGGVSPATELGNASLASLGMLFTTLRVLLAVARGYAAYAMGAGRATPAMGRGERPAGSAAGPGRKGHVSTVAERGELSVLPVVGRA